MADLVAVLAVLVLLFLLRRGRPRDAEPLPAVAAAGRASGPGFAVLNPRALVEEM